MACSHCCYSCRPGKGKHMQNWSDAICFASDYTENISIGGGEPTLHPDFFEILFYSTERFYHTWLATNGKKTKTMFKLADILNNEYYPEDEDDYMYIESDKLSVALSQDCFHDPIDQRVVDLWKRNKWEIRDVTRSHDGVTAQGRAKRTGSGWGEHCPCSTQIIKPDGSIKLCGCERAPIIGDIYKGIESKWKKVINSEAFRYYDCWTDYKRRKNVHLS